MSSQRVGSGAGSWRLSCCPWLPAMGRHCSVIHRLPCWHSSTEKRACSLRRSLNALRRL